jgi:hypothetical protein
LNRTRIATSLADVAQMAERLTCNQQVAGSIPAVGSRGAGASRHVCRGSSSVGRASAFQAERRGFDSRLPLCAFASASPRRRTFAQVAQSAEHVLGKDEVGGSIPLLGLLKKIASASVQKRCARGESGGAGGPGTGSMGAHRHMKMKMPRRSPVWSSSTAVRERYPSGQREQTVNLPAYAFGGSNPPLSMMITKKSRRVWAGGPR